MMMGLLTETDEKVCNVHHVRGVSSGVVIHFVLFPGLVLDNIQKNIDRRFSIFGRRAISAEEERPGQTQEADGRTENAVRW